GDASLGRKLVHRLANTIVQALTGEAGLFTTRIAYARSMRQGGAIAKNLWTIGYDGFGAEPLTHNLGENLFPRWSRTGDLFFSSNASGRWAILRHSFRQRGLDTLVSFAGSIAVGASPRPRTGHFAATLSVHGNPQLYLLEWHGQILKRLTQEAG